MFSGYICCCRASATLPRTSTTLRRKGIWCCHGQSTTSLLYQARLTGKCIFDYWQLQHSAFCLHAGTLGCELQRQRSYQFSKGHVGRFVLMSPILPYVVLLLSVQMSREQFPEYIVGNICFDQAIISIAVRQGVRVVETTDTIHAFHQTGREGNAAGQCVLRWMFSHSVLDLLQSLPMVV